VWNCQDSHLLMAVFRLYIDIIDTMDAYALCKGVICEQGIDILPAAGASL